MIIDLIAINAIPSATILMVSSVFTTADQQSGEPKTMILNIALDRQKACTSGCEFPLYIPATGNYKTVPHIEMQNLFRINAPFVPIKCTDLVIYCKQKDNEKEYYATASKFEVVDYKNVEDIL